MSRSGKIVYLRIDRDDGQQLKLPIRNCTEGEIRRILNMRETQRIVFACKYDDGKKLEFSPGGELLLQEVDVNYRSVIGDALVVEPLISERAHDYAGETSASSSSFPRFRGVGPSTPNFWANSPTSDVGSYGDDLYGSALTLTPSAASKNRSVGASHYGAFGNFCERSGDGNRYGVFGNPPIGDRDRFEGGGGFRPRLPLPPVRQKVNKSATAVVTAQRAFWNDDGTPRFINQQVSVSVSESNPTFEKVLQDMNAKCRMLDQQAHPGAYGVDYSFITKHGLVENLDAKDITFWQMAHAKKRKFYVAPTPDTELQDYLAEINQQDHAYSGSKQNYDEVEEGGTATRSKWQSKRQRLMEDDSSEDGDFKEESGASSLLKRRFHKDTDELKKLRAEMKALQVRNRELEGRLTRFQGAETTRLRYETENRDMKAVLKFVVEDMECIICKETSNFPLEVCLSCNKLIGCQQCIATWYQDNTRSPCPCHGTKLFENRRSLCMSKAFENTLGGIKKFRGLAQVPKSGVSRIEGPAAAAAAPVRAIFQGGDNADFEILDSGDDEDVY